MILKITIFKTLLYFLSIKTEMGPERFSMVNKSRWTGQPNKALITRRPQEY